MTDRATARPETGQEIAANVSPLLSSAIRAKLAADINAAIVKAVNEREEMVAVMRAFAGIGNPTHPEANYQEVRHRALDLLARIEED